MDQSKSKGRLLTERQELGSRGSSCTEAAALSGAPTQADQEGLRWCPGAGSRRPEEAKKCHVCERVGETHPLLLGTGLWVDWLEEGRTR